MRCWASGRRISGGTRSSGGVRSATTWQGWMANGPTARERRTLSIPAGSERTAAPAPHRRCPHTHRPHAAIRSGPVIEHPA